MTIISSPISMHLPKPWQETTFTLPSLMPLTFLVGPNGSGKSRFAEVLKQYLPNSRLLATDRLDGMQKNKGFGLWGDNMAQGFQKSWFPNLKSFGINFGGGIDTIPILAEKLDIRIAVEATLSSLFNRSITLVWDSGALIPKASLGTSGETYRLDSEECHGIKELLVMLTHLYDDASKYLIIDEPELNLHPQFQSFFMEEVRKIAGNPIEDAGKKGVILITHSPFMLDFQNITDLQSVISFSIDHKQPRTMLDMTEAQLDEMRSLVPRINVSHKQIFFSDNPIFVEGIFDSQLINGIQNARKVSTSAAGSCIIEAGGCEEVNKYLLLCQKLGKQAHFIYDLDSLFTGTLRGCIRHDDEVTSFLAQLGLGSSFSKYCGGLESAIGKAVDALRDCDPLDPSLAPLMAYIKKVEASSDAKKLQRARVAFLVQLGQDKSALEKIIGKTTVDDIAGRLQQIAAALKQKNIILLTKGALENYLPSYTGNPFQIEESQKRKTTNDELDFLSTVDDPSALAHRYSGLYDAILTLPAKQPVDFDEHLVPLLSQYIMELQGLTLKSPPLDISQLQGLLSMKEEGRDRVFSLSQFSRGEGNSFTAQIAIKASATSEERITNVSDITNAGMRGFKIEKRPKSEETAGENLS